MTTTTTASLNRNDEWKRCCANAMGFEWVDQFDSNYSNNNNNNDDNGDDDQQQQQQHQQQQPIQQVINLLDDKTSNENGKDDERDDDDDFEEDLIDVGGADNHYYDRSNNNNNNNDDGWMESARRIKNDLYTMKVWIESKSQSYVNLNMKDSEASLIQSTVTSFAATVASEIETLREMIISPSTGTDNNNNNNNDMSNHRSGIIQILLSQLQEYITEPFSRLQKQRTRIAVHIWQNPLQCKLYQAPPVQKKQPKQPRDMLFNDDELLEEQQTQQQQQQQQRDQRFLPKRPYDNTTTGDFISKYAHKPSTQIPPTQPDFLVQLTNHQHHHNKRQRHTIVEMEKETSTTTTTTTGPSPSDLILQQQRAQRLQQLSLLPDQNTNYQQQLEDDLQEETIQLTTQLVANNDLDTVQQMERRMVEITTLIGQFSNLVQEQQEQIVEVYDTAQTTKDNIHRGQENLVDATERTKQSKHYKAYIILFMSLTLLFFHILKN